MSAPFFDKSGTATIFPGDRVIVKKQNGKHLFAMVRRVFMQPLHEGGFEPFCEIQWHMQIQALPTSKTTKCIRYMSDDYVSLAALDMHQLPHANQLVLVWSTKRANFVHATAKAIDFDVCKIQFGERQFEVPTNDVYIMVKRRYGI